MAPSRSSAAAPDTLALDVDAGLPLDIEEYLTWLTAEKGRSVNTVQAYRRDLRAYVAWLGARGEELRAVTAETLTAYVAALRASGRAPASVTRAMVAVRSLHR